MKKFILAGLMAAGAVPALAQVAPVAPVRPMADGVMTRAEVQAMVAAQFARRDSNRDGFVTKEEMMAGRGDGGERRMMIHSDGGPMGNPAAAFDRLDTNKDGMISRDEFAKGREIRIEKRVEMRGPPGVAGQPQMQRMGGMRGGMMGGQMLVMADTNKDGRVSLGEAQASTLQHFDIADTNKDGRLTREEMRAMHEKMMTMHGPDHG
jgi:Ca2+-binding EF-hand superfamily protein